MHVAVGIGQLRTKYDVYIVPDLCEEVILGLPWHVDNRTMIELHLNRPHVGTHGRWTIYTVGATPPTTTAVSFADFEHEVPATHQQRLQHLLDQHASVFHIEGKLQRTDATEHAIVITHKDPVKSMPRDPEKRRREHVKLVPGVRLAERLDCSPPS
ncbi:hypothetical protein PR048_030004 [Dryococelus australis]|uniref:Uncharacterized protein n=1 Tax=Dryococelus australis TaxID=614101 RepID=A0ABQ9G7Q7_9NEOP|nr:hypothetical protein PR048_030004 [Dryococelus australis]